MDKGKEHAKDGELDLSLYQLVSTEPDKKDVHGCHGYHGLRSNLRLFASTIFNKSEDFYGALHTETPIMALYCALDARCGYTSDIAKACLCLSSKICTDEYLSPYSFDRHFYHDIAKEEAKVFNLLGGACFRYSFLHFIVEQLDKLGDLASETCIVYNRFFFQVVKLFCVNFTPILTRGPDYAAVVFLMFYRHKLRRAEEMAERIKFEKNKVLPSMSPGVDKYVSLFSNLSITPFKSTYETITVKSLPGAWVPPDM